MSGFRAGDTVYVKARVYGVREPEDLFGGRHLIVVIDHMSGTGMLSSQIPVREDDVIPAAARGEREEGES